MKYVVVCVYEPIQYARASTALEVDPTRAGETERERDTARPPPPRQAGTRKPQERGSRSVGRREGSRRESQRPRGTSRPDRTER